MAVPAGVVHGAYGAAVLKLAAIVKSVSRDAPRGAMALNTVSLLKWWSGFRRVRTCAYADRTS